MNQTKIDWSNKSWNPITGCLNNCRYCYAQKQAQRFGGCDNTLDS
ncbi:MAG: phage Gp37/Gp68 family protein [Oscillospiraceae bacterium]|nr:phage Gp37/Gp68 family protein [Oscillospiraceae bacterium]